MPARPTCLYPKSNFYPHSFASYRLSSVICCKTLKPTLVDRLRLLPTEEQGRLLQLLKGLVTVSTNLIAKQS
jgi:hypothetical protein